MGRTNPPGSKREEFPPEPEERTPINYADDLRIDKHALEEEWLHQPQRFQKWAALAAQANLEANRADERVKTIRSQLILQAANGAVEGLAKATAQTIEAWYRVQPAYVDAVKALHEAEHTKDVLENAVQAFRQRRDALDNLVRLHLSGYYGQPREPEEGFGAAAEGKLKERVQERATVATERMSRRRKGEDDGE